MLYYLNKHLYKFHMLYYLNKHVYMNMCNSIKHHQLILMYLYM